MIRLICQKLQYIRPRASPLSNGNLFSTSSEKPLNKLNNSNDPQSLTVFLSPKSMWVFLTICHFSFPLASVLLLLVADLENTLKPNLELFQSLGLTGPSLAKTLVREPRILETNANTLVECFRASGFSEKQIATIAMNRPHLFLMNTHKFYKPKVEYFKSLGVSELEVAKILTAEPFILKRSLEKHIVPYIEFLRRVLRNDENVLRAIRASYQIIQVDIKNALEPNISTLVKHGVPKSMISKMFLLNPKPLVLKTYRFNEVIGEVKRLGFDPTKMFFLLALRSMRVVSKKSWKKKLKAYMSFGLTKDEGYSAFKMLPMCMLVSEIKIRKLMCFFVNELSMKPSFICKNPNLFMFRLEKRIAPWCSVLQLLMSKKFIQGNFSLFNVLKINEKAFLEKFVEKYQYKVPEVVEAYQGNIKFQGFSFELKM